eukprot:1161408-Pelagomonas_calceolata.AAC.10
MLPTSGPREFGSYSHWQLVASSAHRYLGEENHGSSDVSPFPQEIDIGRVIALGVHPVATQETAAQVSPGGKNKFDAAEATLKDPLYQRDEREAGRTARVSDHMPDMTCKLLKGAARRPGAGVEP